METSLQKKNPKALHAHIRQELRIGDKPKLCMEFRHTVVETVGEDGQKVSELRAPISIQEYL